MTVLEVINALRWLLIVQTAIGCGLCIAGMQTAILDLVESTKHGMNGGKRLANVMRLKMETLLSMGFSGFLIVGVFFTTPVAEVSEANWWRMVGARMAFNASMFALLCMKVVAYFGRKQLDDYYDHITQTGIDPVAAERVRERMELAAESQRAATAAQVVASDAQDEATKALEPEK